MMANRHTRDSSLPAGVGSATNQPRQAFRRRAKALPGGSPSLNIAARPDRRLAVRLITGDVVICSAPL